MAADQKISSGGPWESVVGYSRAVVAGPWVLVSGSTATVDGELRHVGDAYGQTIEAFGVVRRALEQAGLTLNDVVRTRLYLADMAHEAERLLEDANWLPEVMRTPDLGEDLLGDPVPGGEAEGGGAALPAFLDEDEPVDADNDDDEDRAAAA